MEKNNGKIAIAIVAMFVVALSVVGFTYAYFVARVQGNEADRSVNVTAGILEVAYTKGKTLSFNNLVPGWVSDGNHYFDSDATKVDEATGQVMYYACEKNGANNTNADRVKACDDSKATEANGAVTPYTFTVTNNSTATDPTANYAIILNGVTNQLPDGTKQGQTNEQDNFTYTLTCKECGKEVEGVKQDVVVANNQQFPANGKVTVISGREFISEKNDSKTYELSFSYSNDAGEQTNVSGSVVAATIEIVGIAQAEENGAWYDANGVEIIPATQQGN